MTVLCVELYWRLQREVWKRKVLGRTALRLQHGYYQQPLANVTVRTGSPHKGPLKKTVAADSGKGSEHLAKHTVKKEQILRFSQYIPI